jgi:hypothetical protein
MGRKTMYDRVKCPKEEIFYMVINNLHIPIEIINFNLDKIKVFCII